MSHEHACILEVRYDRPRLCMDWNSLILFAVGICKDGNVEEMDIVNYYARASNVSIRLLRYGARESK